MEYKDVINFWFEELSPEDWYKKDEIFDLKMVEKFIAVHEKAVNGELYPWRETAEGRLAEILILDQFSRNIYRGEAKAFQYDPIALVLAEEAIEHEEINQLSPTQKQFIYMPFMHSESKVIHEKAVDLFSEPGLESGLDYEFRHKKIIDKFGRYPHRNQILGRTNTPAEEQFLRENPTGF